MLPPLSLAGQPAVSRSGLVVEHSEALRFESGGTPFERILKVYPGPRSFLIEGVLA